VSVDIDYEELAERALEGEAPDRGLAARLLDGENVELLRLLDAAYQPRLRHFGRKVMVQVLNNVQNGLCPEDCGYCAQNRNSGAAVRQYPMKSEEEILAEAGAAARSGASRYCMVLSGRGPTLAYTRRLASVIAEVKRRYPVEVCLSAGLVDDEKAAILAEAGLDRLNHNLNTSERHYPKICSTHTYAERVATLEAARRNGIDSCSGLILGMGEETADVVDVAFALRRLEVPSIPVNFLIPIEGNQVTDDGSLTPERCLRALCMVRLVNPSAEIRMAGGREGNLRSLQPLALYPANSLFVEGYLTTRGDAARDTYRMIREAGFTIEGNPLYDADDASHDAFLIPGGGDQLLKPEVALGPSSSK
jgi:biotin synthase